MFGSNQLFVRFATPNCDIGQNRFPMFVLPIIYERYNYNIIFGIVYGTITSPYSRYTNVSLHSVCAKYVTSL